MSHVATGKLHITSLDDLEAAAARLGLTLRRDQHTFAWYGRFMNDSETGRAVARKLPVSEWGKCLHALTVDGCAKGTYEVGVVKSLDGSEGYDLVFDSWGSGQEIVKRCGPQLEKLAEEVGAEVAMRMMARKGYRTQRVVEDGHVNVVCVKN